MAAKNTQNLNFLTKNFVDIYWESSTLVDLHWHYMWLCSSKIFNGSHVAIYLKLFLKDHFTCEAIKP